VPLSGIVLYIGLTVMIFSFWPWVANALAGILNFSLELLNGIVFYFDQMPFSSTKGIYFDVSYLILWYAMLITIGILIVSKNKILVHAILILVVIFLSFRTVRLINNENQKILVVHNILNKTAVSIIHQKNHVLIADSSQIKFLNKASSNMNIVFGCDSISLIAIPASEQFTDTFVRGINIHSFMGKNLIIETNNKRVIVLRDKKLLNHKCIKPQNTDILILDCKTEKMLEESFKYFSAKEIIYSPSVACNNYKIEKVKKAYSKVNFIAKEGSIKLDL
jgi:hypothetical protein